tara:strand:+ start:104 stop:247 length:144 start_codon:yes stop_codon:yes gene_type:complete
LQKEQETISFDLISVLAVILEITNILISLIIIKIRNGAKIGINFNIT